MMNRTTRLNSAPANALAALAILFSGCLVVVEKDDDRHDRHRHLYAEWTVEIIVYRTETLAAANQDVTVTFDEAGTFHARTDCGEMTGSFDVNESNGFTVSHLESSTDCIRGDRPSELFRRTMSEARSYDVDETELRISSAENGMIGLSAR